MSRNFKRFGRFEPSIDKSKELVKTLQSLNLKVDENDRPLNYEDMKLSSRIYEAALEIIMNEDVLNDRTIKAGVQTIVTTSAVSRDVAYIAENIDGILESMRNKVTECGDGNDFAELTKTAKEWETAHKEVSAAVEKLKKLIDTSIEKGFGTRRQLSRAASERFKVNIPEIEKMIDAGTAPDEVAEKFNVRVSHVENHISQYTNQKLIENKTMIAEKIKENVARTTIAEELKVSHKKLNAFIAEHKLAVQPKTEKKRKPTVKQTPVTKEVIPVPQDDNKEKKIA